MVTALAEFALSECSRLYKAVSSVQHSDYVFLLISHIWSEWTNAQKSRSSQLSPPHGTKQKNKQTAKKPNKYKKNLEKNNSSRVHEGYLRVPAHGKDLQNCLSLEWNSKYVIDGMRGEKIMNWYVQRELDKSSATAEDGRPYESSTTLFTSALRRIFSNR